MEEVPSLMTMVFDGPLGVLVAIGVAERPEKDDGAEKIGAWLERATRRKLAESFIHDGHSPFRCVHGSEVIFLSHHIPTTTWRPSRKEQQWFYCAP